MVIEDFVLAYQANPSDRALTPILEQMQRGVRKWGRTDDERQIATIAVWRCAQSWRPGGLGFAHYCKIVARRTIAIERNKTQIVAEPRRAIISRRKEDREAWKHYTKHGGEEPTLAAGNRPFEDYMGAPATTERDVLLSELIERDPQLVKYAAGETLFPNITRAGASLRTIAMLSDARLWALTARRNSRPGTAELLRSLESKTLP